MKFDKQPRILFFLLGPESKASSRVRGFWVAKALREKGVKCDIIYGESRSSYLSCLLKLIRIDILIIQKRYSKWDYYLVKVANSIGKKTIFDIDDAYSKSKNENTLNNFIRIIENVSAVTVGSQNLKKFVEKYRRNSILLPTSIKLDNYAIESTQSNKDYVCLGWIGNGAHYHQDLIKILKKPFIKIASQYKIRFKLVGACKQKELYDAFNNINGLNVTFIDEIDWSDPLSVRKEILDFDIGLYPVINNDFNLSKCGFKALEYMALGIPVVTSPIGANEYIISTGVDGYHASGDEEWIDVLGKLIEEKGLRHSLGMAGRKKVETEYSIDRYAEKLKKISLRLIEK